MGEVDPFLSGVTDHTRQESGDSGLSVSLSHTPEFFSSIDDSMDGLSSTVTDSMDTINFNEAMETPDEFMVRRNFFLVSKSSNAFSEYFFFQLNDPMLLEKINGLI